MSKDLNYFTQSNLGERIQALIDIDEIPIAEIELNRIQGISNDRFKMTLLGFSKKNDLSSLQIKTAKYLFKEKAPINFLYPTPKWIKGYDLMKSTLQLF
jgi:predicted aspartyl protease